MGLRVCQPSSLYQTQVKITGTFIIYYRMGELVTLHYGNFSILAKWAREFAWRTGCFNQVAKWTLQNQLFLDKL